jgi:hypothetical protein
MTEASCSQASERETWEKLFKTKSEPLLTLDSEKRNPDIEKIAALALNGNAQLSQILRGLDSTKCVVRYKNFKAVS